jgi:KipI family sensor histidine kinase inhibitor
VNLLNYGRTAVLVELDSPDDAAALHARLAALPADAAVEGAVEGLVETMPGLRTVLIRFDPTLTDRTRLGQRLAEVWSRPAANADPAEGSGDEVCLRLDYSGPDLDHVAQHTGLTPADVIAAHQARLYRIVLIGMAPGFYFLAGGDPRLRVPRRSSPRVDVPKGAVGLAGELTGIYPRTGPGGWQLIGRAVDNLWHQTRLPAALLAPGTSIRFVAA